MNSGVQFRSRNRIPKLSPEFQKVQQAWYVFSSYNSGARNFLFANVPPIDLSPVAQAQNASAPGLAASHSHRDL
jgi:hypothetical protein